MQHEMLWAIFWIITGIGGTFFAEWLWNNIFFPIDKKTPKNKKDWDWDEPKKENSCNDCNSRFLGFPGLR